MLYYLLHRKWPHHSIDYYTEIHLKFFPYLQCRRLLQDSDFLPPIPLKCLHEIILDELVNFKGKVPAEEKIEDKSTLEQLKLINELEPDDKAMVFRLIDTIITKKKFKDFVATMQ
jgi:hypothetical protein